VHFVKKRVAVGRSKIASGACLVLNYHWLAQAIL
jgi:hypothetical protein